MRPVPLFNNTLKSEVSRLPILAGHARTLVATINSAFAFFHGCCKRYSLGNVDTMHPAVRSLYKEFLHAAKEYPGGMEVARRKLKGAFLGSAKADIANPLVLEQRLARGRFVLRELEALRRLHKYRYDVRDSQSRPLGNCAPAEGHVVDNSSAMQSPSF